MLKEQLQRVLARRMAAAGPQLFWHGTSGTFLRSIMLYGLDPSKIKEGNWRADPNANEINPSKVSYGGIYYAKSMFTAYTYATSICRKTGKDCHPLLISVQLAEISTLPDEDQTDLNPLVLGMINQRADTAAEILVNILARAEYKSPYNPSSWRNYIEKFRQQVFERLAITPEDIAKRQDKARFLGAIDAVLLAGCRRYLSHINSQEKKHYRADAYIKKALRDYAPRLAKKLEKPYQETYEGKVYNYTEVELPAKFRMPDRQTAERAFIKSADYLIKLVRSYVRRQRSKPDQWGSDWRIKNKTLRTLQPVGFRGRNKITSILEFLDETGWGRQDTERYRVFKLHYGTLPEEFFADYRERHSHDMALIFLDRTGNLIRVDNPENLPIPAQYTSKAGVSSMNVARRLRELSAKQTTTLPAITVGVNR